MGLTNSHFVGGVEQRMKPWPTFSVSESLASLRHVYQGSFSLDPEDIKSLILEAIWNSSKGTGFL